MQRHFGLLQEQFLNDNYNNWKVLVTCIFLNCTTRTQVEKVIYKFFDKYPDPSTFVKSEYDQVLSLIAPLGFKNRRYKNLNQMTFDYEVQRGHIYDPRDLAGIGEYGARCYELLFRGTLGDVVPKDHALANYWNWKMAGGHPSLITAFDGRECPCKECTKHDPQII